MTAYTKLTKHNNTAKTVVEKEPFMRLGPFSKLIDTDTQGSLILNDMACINRCTVGKHTSIGCFSYMADTVSGRYCTFASRVSIGAFSHPTDWLSIHEFQYRDTSHLYGDSIIEDGQNLLQSDDRPTVIGSDVWIGDNATVGRGVKIGHGAIVGMSAVVVRDVEPYSIVVGNPGRVVRKRFDDKTISELLGLKWWDLEMEAMKGIDFSEPLAAIKELQDRKLN